MILASSRVKADRREAGGAAGSDGDAAGALSLVPATVSPLLPKAISQLPTPSSLRSRRISGPSARRPRILMSPPISAAASTPMVTDCAWKSGPFSDQSALAMRSAPTVTPSSGQNEMLASPAICTSRPVRRLSSSAAMLAIRSPGNSRSPATRTRTKTTTRPNINLMRRMPAPAASFRSDQQGQTNTGAARGKSQLLNPEAAHCKRAKSPYRRRHGPESFETESS